MAGELFKKAAAYRKKHPGMSMPDAVKICSGKKPAAKKKAPARKKAAPKKKRAAVGRAKRKKAATPKAAPAGPRKVKIKLKRTKGGVSLGISGVSHAKIGTELAHLRSLEAARDRHRQLVKEKGLTATEKAAIRRDIAKYGNNIAASKKHINALKRSL